MQLQQTERSTPDEYCITGKKDAVVKAWEEGKLVLPNDGHPGHLSSRAADHKAWMRAEMNTYEIEYEEVDFPQNYTYVILKSMSRSAKQQLIMTDTYVRQSTTRSSASWLGSSCSISLDLVIKAACLTDGLLLLSLPITEICSSHQLVTG